MTTVIFYIYNISHLATVSEILGGHQEVWFGQYSSMHFWSLTKQFILVRLTRCKRAKSPCVLVAIMHTIISVLYTSCFVVHNLITTLLVEMAFTYAILMRHTSWYKACWLNLSSYRTDYRKV